MADENVVVPDEKTIIRSLLSPTIILDDIILEDLYEGTSEKLTNNKGVESGRQYQNNLGTEYPLVTINGYVFTKEEIVDFSLNANGFMPSIRITVALTNSSVFKSQSMPKDGDIMSIFIRAKNDAFKPIRNDYLITSVDAGKGNLEGRGSNIVMNGELFIPKFYDETIKSYKGTSIDVLQQLCEEFGLGFATNEKETDDDQIWICAGDSIRNFVNHISAHSWKDEKSFFTCYIDVYYHLNFVNVNNQLDSAGVMNAAILDTAALQDFNAGEKLVASSQTKTKKLLTDFKSMYGTNMFITTYQVKNNSSEISREFGYKSFAQFFDQKSLKLWEIFVDPIISEEAAKNKMILKGRSSPKAPDGKSAEKHWQTQNKKYWMGVQYKDVHDKYIYAKLWNERNLAEIEKMYVECEIIKWNPNIYRGEKIPLVLVTQSDQTQRTSDATPGESGVGTNDPIVVANQLYSGYYMVCGISINYTMLESNSLKETFRLTRREWPVPATG
jgi:hypothetical protein